MRLREHLVTFGTIWFRKHVWEKSGATLKGEEEAVKNLDLIT